MVPLNFGKLPYRYHGKEHGNYCTGFGFLDPLALRASQSWLGV